MARRVHDWDEHNPWAAGASARSEKASWAAYVSNTVALRPLDACLSMRTALGQQCSRMQMACKIVLLAHQMQC